MVSRHYYSLRVVLGVLFVRNSLAYDYDEARALRAYNLTEASYCTSTASNWTCPTCDSSVTPVAVIEDESESGGRAVVSYDSSDDTVVVSYRGSENLDNWLENLSVIFTRPYDEMPDVGVSSGFYDWYESLNARGVSAAIGRAANMSESKRIKAVGHSAGGAVAVLLAVDAMRGKIGRLNLTSLQTFGAPRVGNAAFAEWFQTLYDPEVVVVDRITHYHDVVPHVPAEAMFYHHVPLEIWYNEDSSDYRLCDGSGEDPNCADSCFSVFCSSVSDHLAYMGSKTGVAGC